MAFQPQAAATGCAKEHLARARNRDTKATMVLTMGTPFCANRCLRSRRQRKVAGRLRVPAPARPTPANRIGDWHPLRSRVARTASSGCPGRSTASTFGGEAVRHSGALCLDLIPEPLQSVKGQSMARMNGPFIQAGRRSPMGPFARPRPMSWAIRLKPLPLCPRMAGARHRRRSPRFRCWPPFAIDNVSRGHRKSSRSGHPQLLGNARRGDVEANGRRVRGPWARPTPSGSCPSLATGPQTAPPRRGVGHRLTNHAFAGNRLDVGGDTTDVIAVVDDGGTEAVLARAVNRALVANHIAGCLPAIVALIRWPRTGRPGWEPRWERHVPSRTPRGTPAGAARRVSHDRPERRSENRHDVVRRGRPNEHEEDLKDGANPRRDVRHATSIDRPRVERTPRR